MNRKKEIIIISSTLLFFFVIALFWQNTASSTVIEEEPRYEDSNRFVTIKITGEVSQEKTFKIPAGYTYGYVMLKIKVILNDYSYCDFDEKEKIYDDTTIVIKSKDTNNEYYEKSSNKININKASKTELMKIFGIGDARSNRIIDYRKDKTIVSWDELKKLIGVSYEVMERIKEQAILQ